MAYTEEQVTTAMAAWEAVLDWSRDPAFAPEGYLDLSNLVGTAELRLHVAQLVPALDALYEAGKAFDPDFWDAYPFDWEFVPCALAEAFEWSADGIAPRFDAKDPKSLEDWAHQVKAKLEDCLE